MRRELQVVIFILVLSSFAALAWSGILSARPPQDTFVRGFARQPQVRPVREVVVVDSKGKVLAATFGGVGVHYNATLGGRPLTTVLLQVEQQQVALVVARDRLYGGSLFFETENCQGTPWLRVEKESDAQALLVTSAIGPPGRTLYVEAPANQAELRTVKSAFGFSCNNYTQTAYIVAAQPLLDLDTVFTPPFSLRTMP